MTHELGQFLVSILLVFVGVFLMVSAYSRKPVGAARKILSFTTGPLRVISKQEGLMVRCSVNHRRVKLGG